MVMYIELYIDYLLKEKRYSRNTLIAYRNDLNQFYEIIKPRYEQTEIKLSSIDHLVIRSYIIRLKELGNSRRSIARKISSLRSFFKYLFQRREIETNPTLNIVFPKIPKKLPIYADEQSMDRMIKLPDPLTLNGVRDRAILELLYGTGIRLSELTKLNQSDIDMYNDTVMVIGKGDKKRIVPLGRKAKEALKEYLVRRDEFIKTNIRQQDKNALFISRRGIRINPIAVYRVVRKYLSQVSEIEKKSPHVLRHTFATHMLNRGADLKAVKELLGHESLSMTQLYAHVTVDRIKKIYKQAHPKA